MLGWRLGMCLVIWYMANVLRGYRLLDIAKRSMSCGLIGLRGYGSYCAQLYNVKA